MQRSGVVKRVQRAYNKRVRKHTKEEIEKEVIELTEAESESFYEMLDEVRDPSEEFQRAAKAYIEMTKESNVCPECNGKGWIHWNLLGEGTKIWCPARGCAARDLQIKEDK